MLCPLCSGKDVREFFLGRERDYYQCRSCSLVFVPSAQFVSDEDEKKRYDSHQNSVDDAGYRSFLQRLFTPLQSLLAPGSSGLDFGSGPGPVLSFLFEQAGHAMMLFDRFYRPDPSVFDRRYDFITAAEVVEHLREPRRELERLWLCLKEGGILGIMTQPVAGQDGFSQWRYKDDRTHVCFYSRETFRWLALKWDASLSFAGRDVFLFKKREKMPGA